jgi:hypothetical protein
VSVVQFISSVSALAAVGGAAGPCHWIDRGIGSEAPPPGKGCARPTSDRAILSPMTAVGMLVLPEMTAGISDASATYRPRSRSRTGSTYPKELLTLVLHRRDRVRHDRIPAAALERGQLIQTHAPHPQLFPRRGE